VAQFVTYCELNRHSGALSVAPTAGSVTSARMICNDPLGATVTEKTFALFDLIVKNNSSKSFQGRLYVQTFLSEMSVMNIFSFFLSCGATAQLEPWPPHS